MDQTSPKVRLAAMAATGIALIAISIPFVWQHGTEAERSGSVSVPVPIVSHDSGSDVPAATAMEQTGADAQSSETCMADAQPANLDFTLPNLDGKDVTLSDFKGKVILLNFWATWCGPCKAEIPAFVELQDQYRDDLVVLGFSVDDTREQAAEFAAEYKINYPVLLGLGRDEVQDAYGPIWGIPMSFLISRDGQVCKKHMGIAPKAVFEQEIRALL